MRKGHTSALFVDIMVEDYQPLTIQLIPQVINDLYLRGGMNGWGTSEDYKFTQSVND